MKDFIESGSMPNAPDLPTGEEAGDPEEGELQQYGPVRPSGSQYGPGPARGHGNPVSTPAQPPEIRFTPRPRGWPEIYYLEDL